MQVISATVFSKQVIPMLIITAGSGLLICTIWFAYTSSKRERRQQTRPSQSIAAIGSNSGNALSLQDNEDASDFNVFTAKEGAPIKLDLARAYITMRDLAGARSLLEEIINLHPGKIASEAKHMLAEIT